MRDFDERGHLLAVMLEASVGAEADVDEREQAHRANDTSAKPVIKVYGGAARDIRTSQNATQTNRPEAAHSAFHESSAETDDMRSPAGRDYVR